MSDIASKVNSYINYYRTSSNETTTLTMREDWFLRYTTDKSEITTRTAPAYMTEDKDAPDRRLVNAFESEIVDNRVNFLLANPLVISYKNATDEQNEQLQTFQKENDFPLLLMSASKDAGACGNSCILLYQKQSEERPVVKTLENPGYQCIFVRNSDDSETLEAIRFWETTETADNGDLERINYAEFYDKKDVYFLKTTSKTSYDFKIDTSAGKNGTQPHGFSGVPLIELRNNEMLRPSFYKVISLIDAYNGLCSDLSNDLENFRHAYMVMKGYCVDEEVMEEIRKVRGLQVDGDGDIKYLTKDIKTEAFETMKTLLEKNIERFSGNLNYSDPEVYGRATNLAIATRIKPLENHAKDYSMQLDKSLDEMFRLVFDYWNIANSNKWDVNNLRYEYTLDKPINEVEEVLTLQGKKALGMATIDVYGQASFIDKPEEFKARADEEREEETGVVDPNLEFDNADI